MREDTATDLARWATQHGQNAGPCTALLPHDGAIVRTPGVAVETLPGLYRVTVDQGTARQWVGLGRVVA